MKKSLQTLQEFNLQLLYPHTRTRVYEIIAEYAQKLSGADACSIFLQKKEGLMRAFTNVPLERRIKPRAEGFSMHAIRTGQPYVYAPSALKRHHPEVQHKVSLIVILPIKIHKKRAGVITLQLPRGKKFGKNVLKSLEILSGAASLAVEKSELLHELKKAVKARDLFISAASHELKTPLTVVQLYAKTLSDAIAYQRTIDPLWVEKIIRHTTLLNRVIGDFLEADLSTQQNLHLRYDLKPVNVIKLLDQIIETSSTIHPDRFIIFTNNIKQKNVTIMADAGRITQLVNNLVHNAVKFSKPNKPIDIELSLTGSDICIEIIDQGVGIKEQDMNFLFNRYYQGADGKSDGMGVGLYVCKTIAEKHDGMIQISSKEKKGTKASVFLPLK